MTECQYFAQAVFNIEGVEGLQQPDRSPSIFWGQLFKQAAPLLWSPALI